MTTSKQPSSLLLDPSRFKRQVDGKPVDLFVLRNHSGMVVAMTNYGAKIQQILVPDGNGVIGDVVLGYDDIDGVMEGAFAVGAFVGRYAGRIENARFCLAGLEHRLSANNGRHCLHGGVGGTPYQIFDAQQLDGASVRMSYLFADGEEGFPGAVRLSLTYTVTERNELVVAYEGLALDQPTVASFTTHAFFNLNGPASGSALNHELMICADHYFGMTPELIATGDLVPVDGTPFDLRQPVLLTERVRSQDQRRAKAPADQGWIDGYDDCFLIRRPAEDGSLALCARLSAGQSGRSMEVWSTEPAMQCYTGLHSDVALGQVPGKGGQAYFEQMGFCFEPQGYPNAPNLPHFASPVYEPGKPRLGQTVYRFKAGA